MTSETTDTRRLPFERAVSATLADDAQIAPDGHCVAYVTAEASVAGERRTSAIWLVDADGASPRRITSGAVADRSPRWAPDGRYLAFLSDRKQQGAAQIYLLPRAGGEALQITDQPTGVTAFEWSPDGGSVAFLSRELQSDEERQRTAERDDPIVVDESEKRTALWVADIPEDVMAREPGSIPKARRVSPEGIHIGGYIDSGFAWAPDGSGFVVMAGASPLTNDRIRSTAYRLDLDGTLTSLSKLEGVTSSPRYSPDGATLAYIGVEDMIPARFVLLTMPAEGGEPQIALPGFDGSFLSFAWLPDSRRILAGVETHQRHAFIDVDPETHTSEPAFELAEPRSAGADSFSLSVDGTRCAFVWADAGSYGDVYVADVSGGAQRLTDLNPWVHDYDYGELREIAWDSPDGVEIEGLLILPVGYDAGKRYPLLTHIHGGPAAAWTHHLYANWHDWGQFLAQRGYAVFMPNPRGSTGRDSDFLRAITLTYGEADLPDVLSGVDYLIDQGIADPERLVVGGWSGGGYLTNRVITETDRFKAAVSGAGMSNVVSYLGTSDIRDVFSRYFGNIEEDPATAWRLSPIRRIDRAVTPTLILFGENDPRVPPPQGRELYAGLSKRGVESQLVLYPREGHGIGERQHQLDLLRRVIAWFDRHLEGPTPA